MLTAILVFFAMVATDTVFALYVRRAGQGKAVQAGIFSWLIMLSAGYVVVSYVDDPMMLIPASLGAFLGTFLSVKFDDKLQKLLSKQTNAGAETP